MKKLLLYIVFFFSTVFGYAQNLVPNPSFELYHTCPDTFMSIDGNTIEASDNWINGSGFTPDYFNACDTNVVNPRFGVPLNQYGYEPARTGGAYAGIILSYLYCGGAGLSTREYIQVKLTDSLITGQKYAFSMYLSSSDYNYYATNNIGVYFSNSMNTSTSSYVLNYSPQLENDQSLNPIAEKIGWQEFTDTIIADGGEQYITIGNFKSDAFIDTTVYTGADSNSCFSFYYIDDLSLVAINPNAINDLKKNVFFKVFPNPASTLVNISSAENIKEIMISNCYGTLIFYKQATSNYESIDLSSFEKGIYFIKIKSLKHETVHKIILTP